MMKQQNALLNSLLFSTLLCLSGIAQAHSEGMVGTGLGYGFAHPLMGLDHILAMVAVGLWAGQRGAVWRIPLAFVGMMVAGGATGMLGMPLPIVEPGIVASIIVLGALIVLAMRLPVPGGMGLVGLFALFHGHAHGMEMPAAAAEPLPYAVGFVCATLLLHAIGVALSLSLKHGLPQRLVRIGGGAIALAGIYLAAGL